MAKVSSPKRKFLLAVILIILLSTLLIKSNQHFSASDQIDREIALQKNKCKNEQKVMQCWQELLISFLNKNSVDAAFSLIAKLYQEDPRFASSCHNLTHNIGIAAYKHFLKNKDSVLTPKTAYCANGFYHGFMEALLTTSGEADEARKFCEYVDKKLTSLAPDAFLQCYHGIGHGAMDIAAGHKENWGDEQKLIAPAIKLCEEVSRTDDQLYRCVSGIYNAIANYYITGEYKLSLKIDDPYWFCRQQKEKYQESCYGNMNSTIWWLDQGDFAKSAKFIENIPQDKYAIPAIRYLSGLAALPFAKSYNEKAISACRLLQERLYFPCIEGFAHGFLEHGTPDMEYEDAMSFCRNEGFTKEEKEICFKYILTTLGGWYNKDKVEMICTTVEGQYQNYCS